MTINGRINKNHYRYQLSRKLSIEYHTKLRIDNQIKKLEPEIRAVIKKFGNPIKAFLIFKEIKEGAKSREELVKKLNLPRTSIFDYIKKLKTDKIVSYYQIHSGMRGCPSKFYFIADGSMDKYIFPDHQKRIMLNNIPKGRLKMFYYKKHNLEAFIPADTNVLINQLMKLTFKPNDFRFFIRIVGDFEK